ncbi:transposase [Streptomyces sp. SID5614]|uniref:transposase n=1 Tax=Streptomyces sp. SID5614 TaxID=2690306 RepID=UPI0031FEE71B
MTISGTRTIRRGSRHAIGAAIACPFRSPGRRSRFASSIASGPMCVFRSWAGSGSGCPVPSGGRSATPPSRGAATAGTSPSVSTPGPGPPPRTASPAAAWTSASAHPRTSPPSPQRRRQLAYKAPLYGSELRAVPPFHTSQTCAACGRVDPESRKGCGRLFACVHCGHEDDADHNASVETEARARRTGGTVTNSTRSVPRTRVPATGRRRMRETPKPAHAG